MSLDLLLKRSIELLPTLLLKLLGFSIFFLSLVYIFVNQFV
ncbi:hypothetical protein MTR67_040311 [Solanum verrucosum]|uniref:Uncharacterized protein n=1 Tax=Solanum verrucosum TaxID=315347 RepID=A0AAF0UJX6_SOLVR|nr:hypothetical protein MTR67_040311 [Solanum verrucosum]